MAFGGEEGVVECYDPRNRNFVGSLAVGEDVKALVDAYVFFLLVRVTSFQSRGNSRGHCS